MQLNSIANMTMEMKYIVIVSYIILHIICVYQRYILSG